MSYIHKTTGQYPVSEYDIRAAHPNTSFPSPFKAPDDYAWVFPTPHPSYEPITHGVREIAPALSSKGEYEQQWEVYELDPAQVAENLGAAKAGLIEAATAKRWDVMTGGISLPGGMQVGTSIDDQNRITSVVANAELVGLTDESLVDFKSNTGWVQITVGQIKAIAGAIGQFVQACYSAERQHHEAIELLVTAQELRDYDVNAGWEQPNVDDDGVTL